MRRRLSVLLAAALVLGAFALRLPHLDRGLPDVFEEATPVREAVEMWGAPGGAFDPDPGFFKYPSLTVYLHFLLLAARYLVLSLGGGVSALNDFRQLLEQEFASVVLHARVLQVVLGALLVLPAAALGRRLAGGAAGWSAGILVAVLPLAVEESRVVGPDAALALFTAAGLAGALRVASTGDRGSYLAAGLWLGLATSAKYPGALLAAPLLAAHAVQVVRRKEGPPAVLFSGLLIQALAVAAAAFALTSPYVILDAGAALADIRFEQRHMALGHLGREEGRAIVHYALRGIPAAWTWPVAAAAAAGAVLLVARRRSRTAAWVVLAFAAVFLGVLGSWRMAATRYLLPLTPLVAALAGVVVAEFAAWRWGGGRLAAAAAAALLVLPGFRAAALVRGDEREDARTAAAAWLEEHADAGSTILVERYGPEPDAARHLVLHLPFHALTPHVYDAAYSPVFYATFDYVVFSSGVNGRYRAHPREYPAQVAFYAQMERGFRRAAHFPSGEYAGPSVEIWSRRSDSTLRDLAGIPDAFFDRLAGNRPMAEFLAQLGAVLVRDGEEALGFRALEAATGSDRENARTWGTLGAVQIHAGRYEDALLSLRRARELDPASAEIANNLGVLMSRLGEPGQAADGFRTAIGIDPGLEAAYLPLARALVETVRYAEARVVLDEFLRRFPRSARRPDAEAALAELERMGPGRP